MIHRTARTYVRSGSRPRAAKLDWTRELHELVLDVAGGRRDHHGHSSSSCMTLYHPLQALQFVPGALLSNGVHTQPGRLPVSSERLYHL